MFWLLLLAHLLGDYPLQSDRLVAIKHTQRGLLIHVAIHLMVAVVLAFGRIAFVWPYLLLLALLHYAIDVLKNKLNPLFPKAIFPLYLLDQLLHLLSLLFITFLMQQQIKNAWQLPAVWVSHAIGVLLVTHVAYISERIAAHRRPNLQTRINATLWPRMLCRLLLFILFISRWWWFAISAVVLLIAFYLNRGYSRRWMLLDIGFVAMCAFLLL